MQVLANPELLAVLNSQKIELSDRLKNLQGQIDRVAERSSVFSKASSEAMVQERNIRDNLKCRELGRRIQSLEDEITAIEYKVGSVDRVSASSQLQRHDLKHSELLGERAGIFGEMRQLQDQLDRLNMELSTDYRSTEQDYRDQFVRYNVPINEGLGG